MDTFGLLLQANVLIKLVLLVLASLSVVSWAVIFSKQYGFSRAARESAAFLAAFDAGTEAADLLAICEPLRASPVAAVYAYLASVLNEVEPERLRAIATRAIARETDKLDAYMTFLATAGSTSPFIGLFGTVWGIINAFSRIGQSGSASLAVVAPGIAEALVTTAAGLAVAIPAVVAYNYYGNRARQMTVQTEQVAEEIVSAALRKVT